MHELICQEKEEIIGNKKKALVEKLISLTSSPGYTPQLGGYSNLDATVSVPHGQSQNLSLQLLESTPEQNLQTKKSIENLRMIQQREKRVIVRERDLPFRSSPAKKIVVWVPQSCRRVSNKSPTAPSL